ncbi:MAG: pyridoxamine 5'-phosphate oxidase family protein [Deltaproteobacteria bacterium]|nr:pyridoxamine 5'-phosphate oxidase family protein [Deltaproteobacteria bacterium]
MSDSKKKLKDSWDQHEGPIIFSTVDKKGVPNAIYVTFARLLDDGRIVLADNYFNKTRTNIKNGSKGSVLFITGEKKSFQAKGDIAYLTDGPIYEDMRVWVDQKHPRVAAAVLTIEALYSGAEKLI